MKVGVRERENIIYPRSDNRFRPTLIHSQGQLKHPVIGRGGGGGGGGAELVSQATPFILLNVVDQPVLDIPHSFSFKVEYYSTELHF